MTVHLHLAMPRWNKDSATLMFSTLRKFINEPGNEELLPVIRDWFYIATDYTLQAYRRASSAYRDGYRSPSNLRKAERGKIGANNTRLEKEAKSAKRVNERLEDRLNLFETMFKGML